MDSPWTSGLTKPSAFLRYDDDGASLLPFEGHIELGDDDDDDDDVFCARVRSMSLSRALFLFPDRRAPHIF